MARNGERARAVGTWHLEYFRFWSVAKSTRNRVNLDIQLPISLRRWIEQILNRLSSNRQLTRNKMAYSAARNIQKNMRFERKIDWNKFPYHLQRVWHVCMILAWYKGPKLPRSWTILVLIAFQSKTDIYANVPSNISWFFHVWDAVCPFSNFQSIGVQTAANVESRLCPSRTRNAHNFRSPITKSPIWFKVRPRFFLCSF